MNSESWIEVILPDKSIACVRLIRSGRRRKCMCIRVNRSGVCILSSPNEEFESIRDFISDNKAWILKKTKFYTKLNNKLEYDPLQKDEIIYLGKKYKMQFIKDALQYAVISESLMKITYCYAYTVCLFVLKNHFSYLDFHINKKMNILKFKPR